MTGYLDHFPTSGHASSKDQGRENDLTILDTPGTTNRIYEEVRTIKVLVSVNESLTF